MTESKIYELCKIKDTAMCWMSTAMGQGMECLDAKEVGEVADIIKDMCEAEKYLRESEYYKKVTEAMEKESEKPEWMEDMSGYTPDMEMYGYTPISSHTNRSKMRGYRMPTYGYTRPYKPYVDQEPYMDSYLNSVDKRWYTEKPETRPFADGWEMKPSDGKYTSHHLDKMIDSVSEMWDDSDPELRKKIKKELSELVSKMTV